MTESAALLVDAVFPERPVRQWVLSVPYPLGFLVASRSDVMGRVLGLETGPMDQLLGSSMLCRDARMSRAQDAQERPTYRIAVGPQQGPKVFTLQTLPACDESFDDGVGKAAG